MRRVLAVVAVVCVAAYMFGCSKKESSEDLAEPISMEAMGNINASIPATMQAPAPEAASQAQVTALPAAPKAEAMPQAGVSKPSNIDIQTALKNAGFYAGSIDGKIGPKTKKAIEEFQKANGLNPDGKVGPKTWAALSVHLAAPAMPVETQTKKR